MTVACDSQSLNKTNDVLRVVRKCLACGVTKANLLRCSGCRLVHFCGRACQMKIWKFHKRACQAARKKSAVQSGNRQAQLCSNEVIEKAKNAGLAAGRIALAGGKTKEKAAAAAAAATIEAFEALQPVPVKSSSKDSKCTAAISPEVSLRLGMQAAHDALASGSSNEEAVAAAIAKIDEDTVPPKMTKRIDSVGDSVEVPSHSSNGIKNDKTIEKENTNTILIQNDKPIEKENTNTIVNNIPSSVECILSALSMEVQRLNHLRSLETNLAFTEASSRFEDLLKILKPYRTSHCFEWAALNFNSAMLCQTMWNCLIDPPKLPNVLKVPAVHFSGYMHSRNGSNYIMVALRRFKNALKSYHAAVAQGWDARHQIIDCNRAIQLCQNIISQTQKDLDSFIETSDNMSNDLRNAVTHNMKISYCLSGTMFRLMGIPGYNELSDTSQVNCKIVENNNCNNDKTVEKQKLNNVETTQKAQELMYMLSMNGTNEDFEKCSTQIVLTGPFTRVTKECVLDIEEKAVNCLDCCPMCKKKVSSGFGYVAYLCKEKSISNLPSGVSTIDPEQKYVQNPQLSIELGIESFRSYFIPCICCISCIKILENYIPVAINEDGVKCGDQREKHFLGKEFGMKYWDLKRLTPAHRIPGVIGTSLSYSDKILYEEYQKI